MAGYFCYGWLVKAMVSSEEQMKFPIVETVWVLAAVVAFFVVGACDLSAQEAATALSSVQQSAAKARCVPRLPVRAVDNFRDRLV